MNIKIVIPLLFACFLVLISSCGQGDNFGDLQYQRGVEFGKKDYGKIVSSNNELGFMFLKEGEADGNGNKLISPTSLLMALSMVYNGADGVTKEEIGKALQVEGVSVDELNKANASLQSVLQKDSQKIRLEIANSIWLNEVFHFQEDFAQRNKDYFNAAIEEIDITDSESPSRINEWVKKATNGEINEIADDPLDPDLVAILINAIYFKGDWTHAFPKNQTEDGPFYLVDGTTKDIPLMALKEELSYMENESFQAVTLPYGDKEMSMKVFLPREDFSLDEFQEILTEENWKTWNSDFRRQEGTVILPKFQLEYEVLLNETLKTFGMHSAFAKGADFTKMIEEADQIWISKVKQKTYLDVNEEGTEAASVTSVEMVTESASITPNPPFYMEVNRPFFIAITDDETDTILFMGTISNPEERK